MRNKILIAVIFAALAVLNLNNAVAQSDSKKSTASNEQTSKSKEEKKKTPEQVAKNQAKEMKEKLGLNTKQTSEIEAIYLANLKDKNKNPDADHKLMHQQTHDEVNKVLTPDQQKKWKEIRDSKKKDKKDEKGNEGK